MTDSRARRCSSRKAQLAARVLPRMENGSARSAAGLVSGPRADAVVDRLWDARGVIFGAHVIVYTQDAEADRDFLGEVLGFESVDAGDGG
jgi:hypothetical protein